MNEDLGAERAYKALGPDAVPLARATYWPEDMSDRDAEFFSGMLEAKLTAAIGAVECTATHDRFSIRVIGKPCRKCGAVV